MAYNAPKGASKTGGGGGGGEGQDVTGTDEDEGETTPLGSRNTVDAGNGQGKGERLLKNPQLLAIYRESVSYYYII